MTWNIVLGPPGTGKTTYLLNKVEQYLEDGVKPDKLGYLAFTKRAANEALSRAVDKFGYTTEELPYFRTIHSLCYFWAGLSRGDVLDRANLRKFSRQIGEKINSAWDGENMMTLSSKGDRMLFLENMSRNKGITYRKMWEQSDSDFSWLHFKWFTDHYKKFKEQHFLVDYTDMLDMYLLVDGSPRLDVLIIDEAQDLSSLQWSCVEKLARYSKEIYVAGDDDQAIYTWAGADVQKFISLEGSKKVLNQSYRVPRKVHDIALGVVNRIKTRIPKVWKPRKEEGGVYFHNKVEHIDMKEGEWLILARNNYLLNHVEEYLKLSGKVYQKNNKPSVPDNLIEAIQNWEKLRKGEEVEAFKIKKLLTYFKADSGVKKGFKTLKGEDDETLLNMKELKLKFGLLTDKIWHESFELLGDKQREYMISCLRAREKLVSSRIKLNTIHGSKGGEAENVVLLTDMANRSYEELYKNSDHECRAFYVGVTRTKNNLHIVKGKTRREVVFL